MEYKYNAKEYLRVWTEYLKLTKVSFLPSEPKQDVIAKLEGISKNKRELAEIANTIVKERVEYFEKNPDHVTEEVKEELIDFFLLLESQPMNGQRSCDDAIYYRILLLVKDYAKKTHNMDLYAKYVYNCALWYNNFYGSHTIEYTGSPFYDEVMDLLEHFDEIPYLARSVLPFSLSTIISNSPKTYMGSEKELEKVWAMYDSLLKAIKRHKELCEINPPTEDELKQIPIGMIEQSSMYFEVYALQALAVYGIQMLRDEKKLNDEIFSNRIEPILSKYRGIVLQENITQLPISLFIACHALDYVLGNINTTEFLNRLERLAKKCDEIEDPVNRILLRGAVEHPYLSYLRSFSGLPIDEVDKIFRKRLNEIIPMMLEVSHSKEDPRVNMALFECFASASYSFEFEVFAKTVLELTVYSDKALFIHTIMVREMSRVIFDYMIKHNIDFFNGVCDYTTDKIKENTQELRSILDDCCLYHDIGKVTMLDVVENSLRRLTNDEFEFIKTHPHGFELIYLYIDKNNYRLNCIRDCALTHHLWYDGTRGYPMDVKHTKNRPFSDIISISDSIDAATDFLGRPYNSGKTIDDLIIEFQNGAGTHYGPEVAKILSVPEVRDKLDYLINNGRKEVYYQVYVFNKVDENINWPFE